METITHNPDGLLLESQDPQSVLELTVTDINIIGMDTLCRLCANTSDRLIPIYSEEGTSNDLANKMNLYLPVKVSQNDNLPLQCCWHCATTVLAWHELIVACVEADRRLRSLEINAESQIIQSTQEDKSICQERIQKSGSRGESFKKLKIEEETEEALIDIEYDPLYDSEGTTDDYQECIECSIKFPTPEAINNHKCTKKLIGEEDCPNTAGNDSDSKVSDVDVKERTCDYCRKMFQRRCDMLRHRREQHIDRYKSSAKGLRRRRAEIEYNIFCDICSKGFTRNSDMVKHRSTKHPDAAVYKENGRSRKKTPRVVFCDLCKMSFTRKSSMLKHRNQKHQNAPEIKKEKALKCEENVSLFYECPTCDTNFINASDLDTHTKEIHLDKTKRSRRKRTDIIAEYFCDICSKGFTRKFDMHKHRKCKHPDVPPSTEEIPSQRKKNLELLARCRLPSTDNKKYYKCETCDKVFHQSYNFMRHQTVHTGVRAYFCHICGKNFRISSGLSRHISDHHYGVKKYPCDVCGRKFAAKAARNDHMNIHTNNRPFVCDVCGKCFKQKATLHIHKTFHTNVFRFSCNACGKQFRRSTELKIHSWLHTGNKPHECRICGSTFRLSQDLKRHLNIHDKLTECVCTECGATFSQERYLKNHKKTHKVKNDKLSLTQL